MQKVLANNTAYPYLHRQKQSLPEPTRINRRVKSSRVIHTSASTLSIDNIKQQHRITSASSAPSSRSLSIVRRCLSRNESLNEMNSNQKSSWCCSCWFSSLSTSNSYPSKTKPMFNSTPSHSLTNDDDDDEKLSSNDTNNRTPLYTPVQSTHLTCRSVRNTGTPSDVHRRERIRFMKEQKTAKTLAVVVGGFILLWLPFFIMYVIPPEKHVFNNQTVTLITWLGYFNSVINPFIYAYCSKQFRTAFWNITFGIFIKKSSALLPISKKNKQLHQNNTNA
ncbi:unnamed protein product [Rotaria socialis]|nr:unnamed protein product [Rotaria socialis]